MTRFITRNWVVNAWPKGGRSWIAVHQSSSRRAPRSAGRRESASTTPVGGDGHHRRHGFPADGAVRVRQMGAIDRDLLGRQPASRRRLWRSRVRSHATAHPSNRSPNLCHRGSMHVPAPPNQPEDTQPDAGTNLSPLDGLTSDTPTGTTLRIARPGTWYTVAILAVFRSWSLMTSWAITALQLYRQRARRDACPLVPFGVSHYIYPVMGGIGGHRHSRHRPLLFPC